MFRARIFFKLKLGTRVSRAYVYFTESTYSMEREEVTYLGTTSVIGHVFIHTCTHEDHRHVQRIYKHNPWIQRRRHVCPPYTYADNAKQMERRRKKKGRIEIVEERRKRNQHANSHASNISKIIT